MDHKAIESKLNYMDSLHMGQIQKLNPGPKELISMQQNLAFKKWIFLVEQGIIKKDGWYPET